MPVFITICIILSFVGLYSIDEVIPQPMTDQEVIEQTHVCEDAGLIAQVTYRTSQGVMSMHCEPRDMSDNKK